MIRTVQLKRLFGLAFMLLCLGLTGHYSQANDQDYSKNTKEPSKSLDFNKVFGDEEQEDYTTSKGSVRSKNNGVKKAQTSPSIVKAGPREPNNSQIFTPESLAEVSGQQDLLNVERVGNVEYPHPSCLVIIENLISVQSEALKLSNMAHAASVSFLKIVSERTEKMADDLLSTEFARVQLPDIMAKAVQIKRQADDYVKNFISVHQNYSTKHNDDETVLAMREYIYNCLDGVGLSMLAAKDAYEYCASASAKDEYTKVCLTIQKQIRNYVREHAKDEKLKESAFSPLKSDSNFRYAMTHAKGVQTTEFQKKNKK